MKQKRICPKCGTDISKVCASFGGIARAEKLSPRRRKEISDMGIRAIKEKLSKKTNE